MILMIVKSEIFRSRKFATVSMPRDYLSESENASAEVFGQAFGFVRESRMRFG